MPVNIRIIFNGYGEMYGGSNCEFIPVYLNLDTAQSDQAAALEYDAEVYGSGEDDCPGTYTIIEYAPVTPWIEFPVRSERLKKELPKEREFVPVKNEQGETTVAQYHPETQEWTGPGGTPVFVKRFTKLPE